MKEHIEVLERWLSDLTLNGPTHVAVTAAIDLMNAAKPLDDAAEREHCREATEEVCGWPEPESITVLMRERAQARAEGSVAKHAELLPRFKEQERLSLDLIVGRDARIAEFTARLTAAQAEIERFAEAHAAAQTLELHDVTRQLHTVTTPSKGRPLNEERARLELREYIARAHELETKLANLRTAMERELKKATNDYVSVQHKRTLSAIRAAIEASR